MDDELHKSHYENFPVASLLLPRPLREPVAAIYAFARSADDFADEGNLDPTTRLALLAGYRAEPHGINAEGLRRRGFADEEIQAIRRAYKVIYRANLRLEDALDKVREMTVEWPRLQILADFLAAPSRNGIVR
jgi:phytoene/squalene synthetase